MINQDLNFDRDRCPHLMSNTLQMTLPLIKRTYKKVYLTSHLNENIIFFILIGGDPYQNFILYHLSGTPPS
jgi:hypothetical protein